MCCGGHKPSRERQRQVSRRRMVKAMGAGAGLATLSALAAPIHTTAFGTEKSGFQVLETELLEELQEEIRSAISANEGGYTAVSTAQDVLERLYNHFQGTNFIDFLQLNARQGLESFRRFDESLREELSKMGMSEDITNDLEYNTLLVRNNLLNQKQEIQVAKLFERTLVEIEEQEGHFADSPNGFATHSCALSVLFAVGGVLGAGGACSGCASFIGCPGCVGAVIGAAGLAANAYEQCT